MARVNRPRIDSRQTLASRVITINSDVHSGAPCIAWTGIRASDVYGMVKSGDSPRDVAADFGIPRSWVLEAVRYETTRRRVAERE